MIEHQARAADAALTLVHHHPLASLHMHVRARLKNCSTTIQSLHSRLTAAASDHAKRLPSISFRTLRWHFQRENRTTTDTTILPDHIRSAGLGRQPGVERSTRHIRKPSESWGPQQRPLPWRSRAGGGAVHSIISGD